VAWERLVGRGSLAMAAPMDLTTRSALVAPWVGSAWVSCEKAAELLVMGGHGHSCLRELMVGGWPPVLERMTVSVLLA